MEQQTDIEITTDNTAQNTIENIAENTIEINDKIIQERESEIETLCKDITNLRDIFQDISLLVTEQGEHVALIADNIENSSEKVNKAKEEILKTERNQRKSCSRCCVIV
jgi:t-SNARE complex subunit (syntaxin)